jgi:protein-S-isoprenylcysteine O-methyltransferase Ste14
MSPTLLTLIYLILILGFMLGYLPWQVLRLDAALAQSLQSFLMYVGVLLFFLGAALLFFGAYYLVLRGDGTPLPFDPPKRMVVAGPYARMQHPMALGLVMLIFAEAFWFYSASLLVYAVLLTFLMNLYLTYLEEPRLEKRFGDDYRAYRTVVPRWMPRLKASS